MIMTADPENAKAVFATQFQDFGKGTRYRQAFKDLLGHSIFVSDGTDWSDARHMMRPIFARERVSDLDVLERHVSKLIGLIEPGQVTDIKTLLHRFTMDASTEFMFGEGVNSLDNPDAGFAKGFDEVMNWYTWYIRFGLGFSPQLQHIS